MDRSKEDDVSDPTAIEQLKTPQHMEFKAYAAFCSGLIVGIDTQFGYLQMHVNNRPKSADDASKFKIDTVLTLNGNEIAVLDVERKPQWRGGDWPYHRINIPYRPFSCFQNNESTDGRFSTKFREIYKAYKVGRPAWWFAYSSPVADASGQQMMISRQTGILVPAEHMFGDKYETYTDTQPTRYGHSVDVIVVPNQAGILCSCEEDFTAEIVNGVVAYMSSQGGSQ